MDQIKKVLDDDPSQMVAELQLHQIANDLESWLNNDYNLPRIIRVGHKLLTLFPPSALPELRAHHRRHDRLREGLCQIQQELREGNWLKRHLVKRRLRSLADRCEIDEIDAINCVFATDELWPDIASQLGDYLYRGNSARVHANRGDRDLAAGDYVAARRHFEAAIAEDENYIRGHEGLAKICLKTHDYPGAIGHYRRAIRAGSHNPVTQNNLSWFLCKSDSAFPQDLTEAVFVARSAVERAPVARFWDTLAEALLHQGSLTPAIVATRMAIQEDPEKQGYAERMRRLTDKCPAPDTMPQGDDKDQLRGNGEQRTVGSKLVSDPCIMPAGGTEDDDKNGVIDIGGDLDVIDISDKNGVIDIGGDLDVIEINDLDDDEG